PFNIKDWARREDDPRWVYGVPPKRNANYAWMQHILSKLAPNGEAGVVMANGTMTTSTSGEGDIRKAMVEGDVVQGMAAPPGPLFRAPGIPRCGWFFDKNRAGGQGGSVGRRGQVLCSDARELGHMIDRVERTLSEEDLQRIAETFRSWRGR